MNNETGRVVKISSMHQQNHHHQLFTFPSPTLRAHSSSARSLSITREQPNAYNVDVVMLVDDVLIRDDVQMIQTNGGWVGGEGRRG
jgi:hypothetical protein